MPLLFITYNSKSPLLLLLFLHNTPNHCMTEHLALVKRLENISSSFGLYFAVLKKTSHIRRSPNSLFSTQGSWPYFPCSVSTAKLKGLKSP